MASWHPFGPAALFCPADRSARFAKAADRSDLVILDLEDGVADEDKAAARTSLRAAELDPARTVVRVNGAGTEHCRLDLDALATTPYRTVLLAKTESPDDVASLAPLDVIALCETPRGVLAAHSIAQCPNTVALMWGAEDLLATLGGRSSRDADGEYRDVARHARAQVLLAAAAADRPAIDSVHLDIKDLDGLRRDARNAAASGFSATACIHPSQVPIVRDAYRPTPEETAWARQIIAMAANQPGVFSFEGRMVDAPVIRHAENLLAKTSSAARDTDPAGK